MKLIRNLSFRLCELCRTGGEILQNNMNNYLEIPRLHYILLGMTRKAAIVIGLTIAVFSPTQLFAANDTLPNVMVGQTKLTTQDGKVYYGGLTGNYAILNNTSLPDLGFNNNSKYLPGCQKSDGTIITSTIASAACFSLSITGAMNTGVKLILSRTTVKVGSNEAQTVLELPALYFGATNTVIGDTFGKIDYSKFAFWGNSTSSSGDSAWSTSGYAINPDSQSSWLQTSGSTTTDSASYATYYAKVRGLADNAASLTDANISSMNGSFSSQIYLQGSDIMDSISKNDDASKYPEGKTWVIAHDLDLTKSGSTITYYGVGTIIVKGNINVDPSIKIVAGDNQSKLGIISIAGDN